MKIDPSSRIRPPRYSRPVLRKLMGRWIAEDTEEYRTAAYLWGNEIRATRSMVANWGALGEKLRVAHDAVKARLKLPIPQEGEPGWFPVSREWSANELALKDALYQELDQCVRGQWRCEAVQTKLLEAADGGLKARYDRASAVPPQTIDPLAPSDEDLIATRVRIADIWSRDEQRRADLHLLDARRLEFMRDIRSIDLQAIDRALSPNFEPMAASWLRRDTWDIELECGSPNDLHADLIATSPCGVRVAFAKHSQGSPAT
jgi:hypothetical protein